MVQCMRASLDRKICTTSGTSGSLQITPAIRWPVITVTVVPVSVTVSVPFRHVSKESYYQLHSKVIFHRQIKTREREWGGVKWERDASLRNGCH